MAGRPSTVRPTGDHWPSPATGGLANGTMAAGVGRCGTAVTTGAAAGTTFGLRMVPAARVPPTFGWWWEYHSFSAQTTMGAPPCPRNHSAARAPMELPRAGLVSALPSEKATQMIKTPKAVAATERIRRGRGWTADPDHALLPP